MRCEIAPNWRLRARRAAGRGFAGGVRVDAGQERRSSQAQGEGRWRRRESGVQAAEPRREGGRHGRRSGRERRRRGRDACATGPQRRSANVPVAFDVRGRRGRSVFRNDAAGPRAVLVRRPAAASGRDGRRGSTTRSQLPAQGRGRVARRWAQARRSSRDRCRRSTLTRPAARAGSRQRRGGQPGSHEPVEVEQRKLVVFAVALTRRPRVAAGRAQVSRLKPGKRARYQLFFIGNPRGAQLAGGGPAHADSIARCDRYDDSSTSRTTTHPAGTSVPTASPVPAAECRWRRTSATASNAASGAATPLAVPAATGPPRAGRRRSPGARPLIARPLDSPARGRGLAVAASSCSRSARRPDRLAGDDCRRQVSRRAPPQVITSQTGGGRRRRPAVLHERLADRQERLHRAAADAAQGRHRRRRGGRRPSRRATRQGRHRRRRARLGRVLAASTRGNYVIYAGVFNTRKQAAKALKGLKGELPGREGREGVRRRRRQRAACSPARRRRPPSAARAQGPAELDARRLQKKSAKLPDTTKLPGKAPPKDDKKPGGGADGDGSRSNEPRATAPRPAGERGRRAAVGSRRPRLRDGDPRPLPARRARARGGGAAAGRRRARRGRAPAARSRRPGPPENVLRCGALHGRGAVFCWQCGARLLERRSNPARAGRPGRW